MDWKKFNEAIDQATEGLKIDVKMDTDKGIYVHSDSTCFVNENYREIPTDKELTENFKHLAKLCKEMNITLKGRKHYQEVLALYPEAKRQVEFINGIIDELKEDWTKIIEAGVYAPTADNEAIDAASEKAWKINPYINRKSEYSQYHEMDYTIRRNIEELEWQQAHPDDMRKILSIGL